MIVLKILALEGFQFIWGSVPCYMPWSSTEILVKGCIVAMKLFIPGNLASYDMSRTSKKIISLQKLYCFFKVLFMLRILLETLDMVVLRSPL